jgi:uncharacterized damage-inducible protein DinB
MTDPHSELIDTWLISHRIMLYLLDAVREDALDGKPIGMRGRSIKELFAHVHNLRLMWLQVIHADIAHDIPKIITRTPRDQFNLTKSVLRDALTQSGEGLGQGLTERLASREIEIFQPSPTAFVGYLIAHEGYHRGEICMTLTQAGYPIDDAILAGMWVWDKR